ncbi:MAG: hypothetical protein CL578_13160 [Alteromonadaceae bacterium]|jgi:hypothetical protein|uniref:hypothetical protein n=1 Tax=unclassified Methylophaga TaxID=2629249 RepID=UPI000C3AAB10|nr:MULTISPECIES: hypothetical protein [unclassified Methylophaga]MAP26887.1 hypothetical protein [Methylophaga sp.]MBN25984.1 hypothetical protein [Alteromonadaceae bacterium]|tara:strand:+ start:8756 stop:9406 length:651 start_codon:yes stop_codon:yes gene_type:complete
MNLNGLRSQAANMAKSAPKHSKKVIFALFLITATLITEKKLESAIAYLDPDFFGTTVENVIESQNENFSKVQSSIDDLKLVTTDNAAAQTAITQLSKNLELTLATNKDLTNKLKTVADDREILREELKKKKGGDIVPTIAIAEYQTIQYPDLGVLGLRDYNNGNKSIRFTINDISSRLYVGDSVKITKTNGDVCRLVYRGLHEDKHGVEKVCNQDS